MKMNVPKSRKRLKRNKQMETQNQQFLLTQMKEKQDTRPFGMSGDEFLINKKLLKEISNIKKTLKDKGKDDLTSLC